MGYYYEIVALIRNYCRLNFAYMFILCLIFFSIGCKGWTGGKEVKGCQGANAFCPLNLSPCSGSPIDSTNPSLTAIYAALHDFPKWVDMDMLALSKALAAGKVLVPRVRSNLISVWWLSAQILVITPSLRRSYCLEPRQENRGQKKAQVFPLSPFRPFF